MLDSTRCAWAFRRVLFQVETQQKVSVCSALEQETLSLISFFKGYSLNYFPQTITNSANSASGIDLQEPTLKYLFVFIPTRYF